MIDRQSISSKSITVDTPRRRRWPLYVAALVFFALLAFLCLHAPIFQRNTHGAGYDYFFYHWTMWWIDHALATDGLEVFHSDYVMAPHDNNFAYNALSTVWYPTWKVLEPLAGTLSAIVAIIFIGCTLNGFLLFVFLLDEGAAPGIALIGGAALQVFPITRYFYYNTHINLMDWFWLPVHLLIWKRVVAASESGHMGRLIGWAAVQGIAFWGLFLTDLQFPIFVAFLLAPYGLLTLWRSSRRARLIAAGVMALVVAGLLLWFVGPLRSILEFDAALTPSPVDERPVLAFPDAFISMSRTWWDWATPSLSAFVTLAALATTLVAVRSGRGARQAAAGPDEKRRVWQWFWFLAMIPPFLLAIGPDLRIGDTAIPMPFRLMYDATGGNFRMPWRLAPVFVIAAAALAAYVWTPRLPRRRAPRAYALGGAFLLLAISVRLYETGPLKPVLPAYAMYEAIGRETGAPYDDYVVLEVPTGAGTGEVLLGDPEAITFQYYGITHHKRMVNGFISRAPIDHFLYLHTDDPMMAWLGQRRLLEPERVREQLQDRIFDWPVGYIVVHQEYARRNGMQPLEISGYFNGLDDLLCAPVVEGDALFFRTRWHPDGCEPRTPPEVAPGVYRIDVGTSGDERYLGWGWHWSEVVAGLTLRWAGDKPLAQVFVDLPPHAYEVTVAMQAFAEPRRVDLLVNGEPLAGEVTVGDAGLEAYTFALPAALVGTGEHLALALKYDKALVPVEIGQSADQRSLAVAVDWIEFRRVDG
ncbi:MAG: hypothetical protein GX573_04260 [Chloroflexi bacterium]|nr:hypothetical protein [Chloroflexota bacterium]